MGLKMSSDGPRKNEICASHDEGKADKVIPGERFTKIEYGKQGKDSKRDHLLHRFQFGRAPDLVPDPVGWYCKAILKKRDPPTDQHNNPEGLIRELQMPIPGEGHEDVGQQQ